MNYKGLIIKIYGNDHNPPHVHIFFAEYVVVIEIENQQVLNGSLPKTKLKIAKEFVKENKDMLLADFYDKNENLRKK